MKKQLFFSTLLLFNYINFSYSQKNNYCSNIKINSSEAVSERSLVSADHKNLMAKYDVKHYFLDIALERTSTYVSGNVTINALCLSNIDTFAFELHSNLSIDSIFVNAQKYTTIIRSNGGVKIPLLNPITIGNALTSKIYYKGTPPSGASAAIGNGMSNEFSGSWGNQVTWSLSQPFAAYEWWPCKQVLEDKADSTNIHITTSIQNKAGSNGILIGIDTLAGSKVKFKWKHLHPINYYLISVTVAEYVEYTIYAYPQGSPPVKIQNYIYNNPNTLPYFKNEIDKTANLLELYSDLFGLYPFFDEKYGHCMAPFSGGMEHQTMTSQGFFEFSLTAHELAHQWFGDNVTCKTWNDIWVNEGFASYSEYLAYEYIDPSGKASWMNSTHNSVMSENGGSVWVEDPTSVSRIFSGRLTYDKGATIIHMIRFELDNDSIFFDVLKTYQLQYGNTVASTENFKTILENLSGKDFTYFFDQWYTGEGFPTIGAKWNQVNNTAIVELNQSASMSAITPFFQTSLQIKLKRSIGDTTVRVLFDTQNNNFSFPILGNVTSIEIDPNNWILNKNGTIVKDISLGVSNQNANSNKISIYPNPSAGLINIKGLNQEQYYKITIEDLSGRIVKQINNYGNVVLFVDEISKGVYFIKIEGEDFFFLKKFIKN